MTSITKNKYKIFLFIFLIGLLISLLISFKAPEQICGAEKGCDLVLQSKYAKTLGIKNSIYGIFIFTIISLITLMQIYKPTKVKRKIISTSIAIGSLTAVYFIYLQIFIIKAYCQYCLVTDISLIIVLIINIFTWKK